MSILCIIILFSLAYNPCILYGLMLFIICYRRHYLVIVIEYPILCSVNVIQKMSCGAEMWP